MGAGITIEGCYGTTLIDNTVSRCDVGIAIKDSSNTKLISNKIGSDFGDLLDQFPQLREMNFFELHAELVELKRGGINERQLRKSRLGRWLKKQRFVEWAALVTAIAGIPL